MKLRAFYPHRRLLEASYLPRPPRSAMAPGADKGAAPTSSAPGPSAGGMGRRPGPGAARGAPPAPPATPDPSGRRQGAAGGMRDRQRPTPTPASSRVDRPRYGAGRGTPPPAAEAPAPPAAPPRPTATGRQNASGQLRSSQTTGYSGPGPMNPRRATPGAWLQRGRMGGRTTEGLVARRGPEPSTAGRRGPLTAGRMGPLSKGPKVRSAAPATTPSPSNGHGPYGGGGAPSSAGRMGPLAKTKPAPAPSFGENIAYGAGRKGAGTRKRSATPTAWAQRG